MAFFCDVHPLQLLINNPVFIIIFAGLLPILLYVSTALKSLSWKQMKKARVCFCQHSMGEKKKNGQGLAWLQFCSVGFLELSHCIG